MLLGSKLLGLKWLDIVERRTPGILKTVVTIDDEADERSCLGDYHTFCSAHDIDIRVVPSRREAESVIREKSPDLCLVNGWYWLFSKEVLSLPKSGFVGQHNSLLPKYRGGAPLVWAMINGESDVGFTIFYLSEKMDDGPIVFQGKATVDPTDYVANMLQKIESLVDRTFPDVWDELVRGEAPRLAQDDAQATFCTQRTPDHGRIDWNRPARDVFNFVRAQSHPYPGAFFDANGRRVHIFRARRFENRLYGVPGSIGLLNEFGVYAVCGDSHAIILEEVTLDGAKSTPTKAQRLLRTARATQMETKRLSTEPFPQKCAAD